MAGTRGSSMASVAADARTCTGAVDAVSVPALQLWSGGKDSAMALWTARQGREVEVQALASTIAPKADRTTWHGVRTELMARQAEAIGLPFFPIPAPAFEEIDDLLGAITAFLRTPRRRPTRPWCGAISSGRRPAAFTIRSVSRGASTAPIPSGRKDAIRPLSLSRSSIPASKRSSPLSTPGCSMPPSSAGTTTRASWTTCRRTLIPVASGGNLTPLSGTVRSSGSRCAADGTASRGSATTSTAI